ncbi:MAG TPA: hypothetical protein VGS19_07055 [Streptosporangiaceae bacterium]|nr:hypothetical protein [Streptosporangiaceae bacterium]
MTDHGSMRARTRLALRASDSPAVSLPGLLSPAALRALPKAARAPVPGALGTLGEGMACSLTDVVSAQPVPGRAVVAYLEPGRSLLLDPAGVGLVPPPWDVL